MLLHKVYLTEMMTRIHEPGYSPETVLDPYLESLTDSLSRISMRLSLRMRLKGGWIRKKLCCKVPTAQKSENRPYSAFL